uniref:Uncharacterized protein n=1 Tax=Oncorhynchus tshawytscha TaxID=74940 RepID=A0A8C8CSF0_ONCTS
MLGSAPSFHRLVGLPVCLTKRLCQAVVSASVSAPALPQWALKLEGLHLITRCLCLLPLLPCRCDVSGSRVYADRHSRSSHTHTQPLQCGLAKQLERKEAELQHLAAFYKEQLHILEKKNLDYYQQTSEQYNEAADKAEAHIKPRPAVSICPELQAQVLHCYKENQQQTLHCSTVAKEYMDCIQAAKKTLLINHG